MGLTKPKTVDMTETVESLSNCRKKKHDSANIYEKKRTMCGSSTFPICVTERVSEFPFSNSNHKPVQRGELRIELDITEESPNGL